MASEVRDSIINKNHVWIDSNELGRKETQETLRKLDTQGTLFIGTGCLEILNLASLPRPNDDIQPIERIIAFDCSSKVKKFWDAVYPMLVEELDANRFQERLLSHLKAEQWTYFPPVVPIQQKGQISGMEYSDRLFQNFANRLDGDTEDGLTFLSKDPPGGFSDTTRYDKIHSIFKLRNFHFIPFDLCGRVEPNSDCCSTKAFWNYVSKKGPIDTFYVSNILEMLEPEDRPAYTDFVKSIPSNSIFVDARIQLWSPPNPKNMDDFATQRVTCNSEFPTKPSRAYLKKREFAESQFKLESEVQVKQALSELEPEPTGSDVPVIGSTSHT